MKKWMVTLLLVLFSAGAFAQGKEASTKGTRFEKGTLKELLAKADTAKKYLFVDIYTTWCGPCKAMASEIFPQQKVGAYLNKTFINAKFDAEKGEGIDIAKTYQVRAYPTFLILKPDGTEVGRIIGGGEADVFIKKVQEAVANIEKE